MAAPAREHIQTLPRLAAARFAAILDRRLALVLSVFVLLSFLVAQLPFAYSFTVGRERGVGSDLPFLQGFYLREDLAGGDPNLAAELFRWSRAEEAVIEVPGTGRRGVVLVLDIVSHRAQWVDGVAPTVVTLQTDDGSELPITLRREAAVYQVYLPPHMLKSGRLKIAPRTELWQKPGDSRDELGFALARRVVVTGTTSMSLVLPDRPMLLGWTLGLALLWGCSAPSASASAPPSACCCRSRCCCRPLP